MDPLYNRGMAKAVSAKGLVKRGSSNAPVKVVSESMVERIHRDLRNMAITFRFLPGERLNEAVLARELGVSRTPLREALSRLSSEGFLTFSPNQGFFRKPLDVKEIYDLYEFRLQIETTAVRLVVERATDEQLLELERFVKKSAENDPSRTLNEVISLDEEFHERLIFLTGNLEMRSSLRNVNERIRYVRWVDMDGQRPTTQIQHKEIVRRLRERNVDDAVRLIREHIGHRMDQVIDKVGRSYGRIYMSAGRQIEEIRKS